MSRDTHVTRHSITEGAADPGTLDWPEVYRNIKQMYSQFTVTASEPKCEKNIILLQGSCMQLAPYGEEGCLCLLATSRSIFMHSHLCPLNEVQDEEQASNIYFILFTSIRIRHKRYSIAFT